MNKLLSTLGYVSVIVLAKFAEALATQMLDQSLSGKAKRTSTTKAK